jgi:SAM-dependent methyltransferase
LWVLKSVYLRVLEDRGLLSPGRLLDPEAQQLFERLAPHLGETAFLRWVYRDLASPRGGLPELFSPQPAEVALPSDELSRALIAFWRNRDADTGAQWSFADEHFEGELMGDLYQELDPVVKERFALCQTPDFVRGFILDRTLTPAIETFGADEVRLLDPACGSGHFLIDGLKRIVAATAAKHPDWEREQVVTHALERVVGIDLNDYACGLARARLVMTAAELAGKSSLAETAHFHPHVYWADGLEQVERDEVKKPLQTNLFEKTEERPRATLTRADVRTALRKVFAKKFHAVVANPPYILERDEARKAYHRELIGKNRRYVSATGKYSLASPFTERCFQLAEDDGFVGIIMSNNFTKRDFGKALIEKVLASVDLTLVVDAAQAYIPFHATPTVLLFGRHRRPEGTIVHAVLGKRGEPGTPADPARGEVWRSIAEQFSAVGFENEYVSVADVPRSILCRHPWSLAGGGAAELKQQLEQIAQKTLGQSSDSIGITCFTLEDDAFITSEEVLIRHRVPPNHRRSMVEGDQIRDWGFARGATAAFPYDEALNILESVHGSHLERWLWPYKACLSNNKMFGGRTKVEDGLKWYEYGRFTASKLRTPLSIVCACVATHNHFALDSGEKIFKQSVLVIKLPPKASKEDHFALLGLLNSSTGCFWMKQVFYPKGSKTHDIDKAGTLPENNRFDFAATGLSSFPIPIGLEKSIVGEIAAKIDALAIRRSSNQPDVVIRRPSVLESANTLRAALVDGEQNDQSTFLRMVHWQEELDWEVYALYGVVPRDCVRYLDECQVDPDARPFLWPNSETIPTQVPTQRRAEYESRRQLLLSNQSVALLENPVQKRLWRGIQGVFGRYDRTYAEKTATALKAWLADRVEAAAMERTGAFSLDQIVASLQDDPSVLAVSELLAGRRDFNLSQLVAETLFGDMLPNHRFHIYKPAGLVKREAWERTWEDQRREDAGEKVTPEVPPSYGSVDFLKSEYWQLRGKLDVPKERFIAFTEVPGRSGAETLYGWAGWTPVQRLRAILAIDENLEDADVPLADRIGLLDTAWRLLPDVAREDAAAAARLKAELQALVGPQGPSRELIDDWKKRFPPPTTRAAGARRLSTKEEVAESFDDLPTVIPDVSDGEAAALFIWALLYASGGTATRMDLARAFALRARPNLLKRLAPGSLKREAAHWVSTVGSRSVKAGLLASSLGTLVDRNGVLLGTDGQARATVSTSAHTPTEDQIDPWFRFEAGLAMKVLRAQPEEKFSAIDKSLSGADRKLLESAA